MGPASERVRVRRKAERARYGTDSIHAILDAALVSHIGFVRDGAPVVLPMIHARVGDTVYLHGSTASGMLGVLRDGDPVCLTATIVDGIVFARSAVHHSMNYRSVVVLGGAREVTDPGEKVAALRAVVEHVAPGRWDEVRPPSARELAATLVLSVSVDEASAKVRTGPPIDEPE